MASTASPSLKLELMGTGDQSGTWGVTTNTNLGTLLEQAITGYQAIAKVGTGDYTLSNTDYIANENRNAVIEFTGTPGGAFNVIVPLAEKLWVFKNATNGAMTVKASSGTGVTVPVGTSAWLFCDGTDVRSVLDVVTYYFTSTASAFGPLTNDGQTLGTTSLKWSDLFLADGGVINFNSGDVTITQGTNALAFAGASNGYTFDAAIRPAANDGAALGVSGTAFSDLFLASGGVINFDADDVTITHSANTLAFAGATSYTFNGGTAYYAGGTDVALADGGTGASLTDPGADRLMFWDDSAGQVTWLEAGSGLTITDTTLSVSTSSPISNAVGNNTASNTQTFNSSGTWTKPNTGNYAIIYAWAGGSQGDVDNNNGPAAGSGGGFSGTIVALSALGSTETVTVGAGGVGNNSPGNTNIGTVLTAYRAGRASSGGSNTTSVASGGGGGSNSIGTNGTTNATNGSSPTTAGRGGGGLTSFVPSVPMQAYGMSQALITGFLPIYETLGGPGADGAALDTSGNADGIDAVFGGGSGGVSSSSGTSGAANGGSSVFGGGGGAAGGNATVMTAANGGLSVYGGRGGFGITNTNVPGVQPGGGGGAFSTSIIGAGAAGKVIVYVY